MAAPVTLLLDTVHTYCVPATLFGFVKLMVGVDPLQIVKIVLLTASVGFGLTVIVAVIVDPLQPFALGVIVYVTVPAVLPVVLLNNWLIVLPLPALAPVTLVADTVQLNVVPVTAFGFVRAMLVVSPLQIVCVAGVANAFGIGLTSTVTVWAAL